MTTYFVEDNRLKTGDPITVLAGLGVGTATVGACETDGFWAPAYFCIHGQPEGHTVWCYYTDEGIAWVRGHAGEDVEALITADALL